MNQAIPAVLTVLTRCKPFDTSKIPYLLYFHSTIKSQHSIPHSTNIETLKYHFSASFLSWNSSRSKQISARLQRMNCLRRDEKSFNMPMTLSLRENSLNFPCGKVRKTQNSIFFIIRSSEENWRVKNRRKQNCFRVVEVPARVDCRGRKWNHSRLSNTFRVTRKIFSHFSCVFAMIKGFSTSPRAWRGTKEE
jgi:hypothetical protein